MKAIHLSHKTIQNKHSSDGIDSWTDRMDRLQDYRLFVMGGIFMLQANIIVPATMLTVLHFGLPPYYLAVCTLGFFAILVSNLASEKVRYSIPIFVISTIFNLLLIMYVVMSN